MLKQLKVLRYFVTGCSRTFVEKSFFNLQKSLPFAAVCAKVQPNTCSRFIIIQALSRIVKVEQNNVLACILKVNFDMHLYLSSITTLIHKQLPRTWWIKWSVRWWVLHCLHHSSFKKINDLILAWLPNNW